FVDVPASTDPANLPNLLNIIRGDTTATGDRNDVNTIYRLENGGTYVFTGTIRNTADWPLQIQAQDLNNTDIKPVIVAQPNSNGDYPNFAWVEGDLTFKNLWVIVGEDGPLANHKFSSIRILGPKTRVIVEDCIMEKNRGGMIQVRADSVKIYMDNCILRNGGNRRVFQGNGRGIDFREFTIDTMVMTNTVVHNIVDRFIRSQGVGVPHNYIKIDHCTSFNTSGRHGFIQLARVNKAIITNNLFINPIMAGTTPAWTDEQNQPDSMAHKVITLDTVYTATELTISNNNIFWTQDVIDFWATKDTVSQPEVLSQLVKQVMGADTADAFFSEALTLNDVPQSILPYVMDIYNDNGATDMFDIIVEDSIVAGGPTDSGNLYDFDDFDVCYPAGTQSATASTDGGPIGAVVGCENFTNIASPDLGEFEFKVSPNPVSGSMAAFEFEVTQSGETRLAIYDLNGRLMSVVQQEFLPAGPQRLEWKVPAGMASGLYLARLQSAGEIQTLKFILD
ncbi:MAG: T9SS type A sorting domain-containing protein, partial [Bacteroidota bacterium]